MTVIKTVDLRNDFKKISDLVMSGEKVLISRPRNENLIVMSEREYNELKKINKNYFLDILTNDSALRVAEEGSIYLRNNKNATVDTEEILIKIPRKALKGILKGSVCMSDNFDEPLEETEEYM